MTGAQFALVGAASLAAGAVNALAGGGTLITFPVLLALGLPAVAANVTSTVALCPGYLGATLAQSKDLAGQKRRMIAAVPAGILGGLAGGFLLLHTGERLFRALVPFLILLASALLALQEPLRKALVRRWGARAGAPSGTESWIAAPLMLAAVYGGYFGAGMSVIILALLGLFLDDDLTRLNALKQFVALTINVSAATFFLFSGQVVWPVALIMACGALAGGALGGRLAGRVDPVRLRWIIVVIGVAVAVVYLVKS